VRLQLALVGLDELAEGLAIAGLGSGEGCLGHGGTVLSLAIWITPSQGATPVAPRIHRRITGESPARPVLQLVRT
jgi:hypothetical protein